jgi:hypothetical protein
MTLVMLEKIPSAKPVTAGGDKNYDTFDFVAECRNLRVTPHVAQNHERRGGSAIDERTTRHQVHQPNQAEAHRRMFRLAEDHRVAAESSASWNFQGGLGIQLRLCRLQSGAHEEPGPSGGPARLTRGEACTGGVKARPLIIMSCCNMLCSLWRAAVPFGFALRWHDTHLWSHFSPSIDGNASPG